MYLNLKQILANLKFRNLISVPSVYFLYVKTRILFKFTYPRGILSEDKKQKNREFIEVLKNRWKCILPRLQLNNLKILNYCVGKTRISINLRLITMIKV